MEQPTFSDGGRRGPALSPGDLALGDTGFLSRWAIRGHSWAQRSLHTILRKPSIGFTWGHAQCITPPFNLASTTSLLPLSTTPLPMGVIGGGKVYRVGGLTD